MRSKDRPRICMSVINDLSGDQRVHRIACSLEKLGYQVLVIGRKLPDSPPLGTLPYAVKRMRLLFRRGKVFYLEYNFRLFLYLCFRRVDILHANDLDTLLANFLVSRLRRKQLVYDSHEYFTEVPELINRPYTQQIWQYMEGWILPQLQHVFTVNQSIADLYAQKYHIPVEVVRNLPFGRLPGPGPKLPTSSEGPRILLYQGALNLGRGIELMINAMNFLPGFKLWIVGKGDLASHLMALAAQQPHPERIVFKGFVPFQQLPQITQQATLGFSLEEDLGANYRYASPNKVYDYIQAGVPVLVSDLPEMKRLVQHYKVGEILKSVRRTPRGLATQVLRMLEEPGAYEAYQARCRQAAAVLTWENEQLALQQLYEQVAL